MKKTLAAVLAAAMALSTATVAFATDYDITDADWEIRSVDDDRTEIRYGKDVKMRIKSLDIEGGGITITGEELCEKIDNGEITLTPIVTEGSTKLASKPSVTVGKWKAGTGNVNQAHTYLWNSADVEIAGVKFRNGKKVTRIPVGEDGNVTTAPDLVDKLISVKDFEDASKGYQDTNNVLVRGTTTTTEEIGKYDGVQVKFKVADTYGVDDTKVALKFRITIKKKDVELNGEPYAKGDTLTSDEIKFKAVYGELNQYAEDMQLTLDEVDARNVKLDASNLYDEIGADTFTVTFEDTAVFETKLSSSQKDVNLFYSVDEDSELAAMYPDVDFEFIEFMGKPSFVNSGSLVFPAENKNYTVYEWDGEAWVPMQDRSTFDPTYKTVTVKNIKKLGRYAIASEILPVEEEPEEPEPAEPVSSAPTTEPDDEGGNPNTGAC